MTEDYLKKQSLLSLIKIAKKRYNSAGVGIGWLDYPHLVFQELRNFIQQKEWSEVYQNVVHDKLSDLCNTKVQTVGMETPLKRTRVFKKHTGDIKGDFSNASVLPTLDSIFLFPYKTKKEQSKTGAFEFEASSPIRVIVNPRKGSFSRLRIDRMHLVSHERNGSTLTFSCNAYQNGPLVYFVFSDGDLIEGFLSLIQRKK